MIHTFALIMVDSVSNANDSNCFHGFLYFFIEKDPTTSGSLQETSTEQPPGHSPLGVTSAHATSPEATGAEATSGNIESQVSSSASASELSQEIPVSSCQTYEDTIHLLDATTFKDYNFYSAQDVEGLIKQIPDISPYIDSVPEDEEPVSRSRNLTKKELAKLAPEAKILNISSSKKAKEIKDYLLEKFDRILVDTLDKDNNNYLFQSILCQISSQRFMVNSHGQPYDSQCLRLQTVAFMTINYEEMYNRVKHSLTSPYKRWLLDMIDPMTDGDTVALIGMRHLLKVSLNFKLSISFAGLEDSSCQSRLYYFPIFTHVT